jgi:hypothetical protein
VKVSSAILSNDIRKSFGNCTAMARKLPYFSQWAEQLHHLLIKKQLTTQPWRESYLKSGFFLHEPEKLQES